MEKSIFEKRDMWDVLNPKSAYLRLLQSLIRAHRRKIKATLLRVEKLRNDADEYLTNIQEYYDLKERLEKLGDRYEKDEPDGDNWPFIGCCSTDD